jgi:protein ImuA
MTKPDSLPPDSPDPAAPPGGEGSALAALRAALAQGTLAHGTSAQRTGAPGGGTSLPPLAVLPPLSLARGRVHEATGPARRTLAAMVTGAAQAEGPVMWLRPAWRREGLYPAGLIRFADPGALITVACPKRDDVLWAAEEALRAGCVALVVAELPVVPDLRQVRRLHLAAAEGVARAQAARGGGRIAPLGLVLAAEAPDSALAGVESRWSLAPLPPRRGVPPVEWRGEALPAWRLERLRARDAPPGAWQLDWRPDGYRATRLGEG